MAGRGLLQCLPDGEPAGLETGVQAVQPLQSAAQVLARCVQAVCDPLLKCFHIPACQTPILNGDRDHRNFVQRKPMY